MILPENLRLLQRELGNDEAALVISDANRFYLTGFRSSSGFCIITGRELCFFTDSRYIEAARTGVRCFSVHEEKGKRLDIIKENLSSLGISKLNIEAEHVTVSAYSAMREKFSGIGIVADGALDRILKKFRTVKTEEELSLIRHACEISDRAFTRLLEDVRPGVTERQLAARLEYLMRDCGGDGPAFDTIVVAGKNSSKPHGVPSDTTVKNGDFITMDFGASYKGYLSDVTRTVAVGSVSDDMRRVYDIVLRAQLEGLSRIRAGVPCKDVDKAARNLISQAGYGGRFGHGLGHSVGIEIHEGPNLSPASDATLEKGVVVTCEPGIYLEGRFGVRIEDTVYVEENGGTALNRVPKDLMVL